MDKQAVFDKALNTIRAQGGPAADEGGPVYRTADGRRACAIGANLTEEQARAANVAGGAGSYASVQHTSMAPILAIAGMTPNDLRDKLFLSELQGLHDELSRRYLGGEVTRVPDAEFFKAWEPAMREFARDFGLTYAEPTS